MSTYTEEQLKRVTDYKQKWFPKKGGNYYATPAGWVFERLNGSKELLVSVRGLSEILDNSAPVVFETPSFSLVRSTKRKLTFSYNLPEQVKSVSGDVTVSVNAVVNSLLDSDGNTISSSDYTVTDSKLVANNEFFGVVNVEISSDYNINAANVEFVSVTSNESLIDSESKPVNISNWASFSQYVER